MKAMITYIALALFGCTTPPADDDTATIPSDGPLSFDSDEARMLGAGFDAYLPKPLRYREVLATVRRLVGG